MYLYKNQLTEKFRESDEPMFIPGFQLLGWFGNPWALEALLSEDLGMEVTHRSKFFRLLWE